MWNVFESVAECVSHRPRRARGPRGDAAHSRARGGAHARGPVTFSKHVGRIGHSGSISNDLNRFPILGVSS